MDTSLNIIWDKKFMTNRLFISNLSITMTPDSNILIGSALTTGSPNHLHSLYFLEITKEGDSLKSSYFNQGYPPTTDIQSIICINGQYKAFVDGYEAFTSNNCFTQILALDTDLNWVEIRPIPNMHDGFLTAEKIDETRYFLSGMAYISPYSYDIAISKFDTVENTLSFNHAGTTGDVSDYSAWKQCKTIANSNSIYVGGTGKDNGDFIVASKTGEK
ncbi:MAG: hypothetical protein IPF68_17220 [Bacteroidales bacterium]|nr:hypothetical protein [Bacteroidales bacterium]